GQFFCNVTISKLSNTPTVKVRRGRPKATTKKSAKIRKRDSRRRKMLEEMLRLNNYKIPSHKNSNSNYRVKVTRRKKLNIELNIFKSFKDKRKRIRLESKEQIIQFLKELSSKTIKSK